MMPVLLGPAAETILSNSLVPAHRMVIENNSAGLGIPRGGIKDMPHLSTVVRQNGSRRRVSSAPMVARPMINNTMINNTGMPRPSAPSSAPRGSSPMSSGASRQCLHRARWVHHSQWDHHSQWLHRTLPAFRVVQLKNNFRRI